MKASLYVALGRFASSLYLSSITILVGAFVAIVAAVVSPMMERFLADYGILTALVMAATLLCLPIFFASVVVGYVSRCPECGKPFSQVSVLPDKRMPSNFETIKRCLRTAAGRECICNACESDAMVAARRRMSR